MQYEETAQASVDVKAECMGEQMKNAEDSLQYLAVLAKLYETEPTNSKYFSWLMKFYQHSTARFNIESFIDHQLVNDSKSAIPWILKGEIAMQAGRMGTKPLRHINWLMNFLLTLSQWLLI